MFFNKNKQMQELTEVLQRVLAGGACEALLLGAYPQVQACLEQFAQQRAQAEQRLLVAEGLAEGRIGQLARSEQLIETLRQQLEQTRYREQALEVELSQQVQLSRQHQQEAQIWELLQSTLTEGCWDITVVNGDVQDPSSSMRFSNQFRLLMGYGRRSFPSAGTLRSASLILTTCRRSWRSSTGKSSQPTAAVNMSLNTECAIGAVTTFGVESVVVRPVMSRDV